jgi:hypothetical protein
MIREIIVTHANLNGRAPPGQVLTAGAVTTMDIGLGVQRGHASGGGLR